jgi:predicted naringenin-chalcone synthase
LSKIISIGTAVPQHRQQQDNIPGFMQRVYALSEAEKRKLRFLYRQSGIENRYTVIPDFGLPAEEWTFFAPTENLEPVPTLEKRMEWFRDHAAPLSVKAIDDCIDATGRNKITHLITVSCTGMSAPALTLTWWKLCNYPPTSAGHQ